METTTMDYTFSNGDDSTTTATTDYITTTDPPYAPYIVSSAADILKAAAEKQQHNQITFEIPSHHDLEHINTLHKFNTLLQRIGNVAYDSIANAPNTTTHDGMGNGDGIHLIPSTNHVIDMHQHVLRSNATLAHDAAGQAITNEQISKSVVLDLADLKSTATSSINSIDAFFAGTDMHSIINYLWIGVVTSLVILSVIFIIFSCYFYRKFREWKKCNKDIRSHLNNDMYPGGTLIQCDSLMAAAGQAIDAAAYYQMESPPCYTIATGLPTYDEALYHQHYYQQQQQQQQLQQQPLYGYDMKFVYPKITAAIHHHHHHPATMMTTTTTGVASITNWEKEDLTFKYKEQQHSNNEEKSKTANLMKIAKTFDTLSSPPLYDDATLGASVALLATHDEKPAISICMQEETSTDQYEVRQEQEPEHNDKGDDICYSVVIT